MIPVADKFPCDQGAAEAFLRTIDADAKAWTFQLFDDNAERRAANIASGRDPFAKTITATLTDCWARLVFYNDKGAGVFVTFNETDLKGRKIKNVVKVRGVFVDLDGAPIDPVLHDPALPRPHIINETSPGRWHAIWLATGLALDQFEPLQHALAARFNGDPSVCDLPRVIRLPGFWHRKAEPFLCRMVSGSGEPPLDGKEFAKALAVADVLNGITDEATTQPEPTPTPASVVGLFTNVGDAQSRPDRWRALNEAALYSLKAWVPELFPGAKRREGGYRVSSASLKRALQEDISITRDGIKDFGVHDIGDPRQGRRTAIDLVSEWKGIDHREAFEWLSRRIRFGEPEDLSSYEPTAGAATADISPPFELFWHGEPDDRPPATWLADRMIPATGVGLMAGQWGACKTFIAFDLVGNTASGLPFAGRDIVRPGCVLFVAAEGGDEVRDRLKGVDQKLSAAAFVAAAAGNATEADLNHLPIVWGETPIRFNTADGFKLMLAIAAAAHKRMLDQFGVPLVLIIIDTLGASVDFKDGNDSAETQTVMNRLRDVSRATGAFILTVDHFGKNIDVGVKGSSTKEDNADLILAALCDRDVGGSISNTRMKIRKLRRGKSGVEFPFDLDVIDIGDGKTTCAIKWKPERDDGKGTSAKASWTKPLRLFKAAMEVALADSGKEFRPYGQEGPMVKAVPLSLVRLEFVSSYPTDGEDQRARDAAKRSAFGRALKSAREKLLVCSREIEGVDQLWIVNEEELEHLRRTGP